MTFLAARVRSAISPSSGEEAGSGLGMKKSEEDGAEEAAADHAARVERELVAAVDDLTLSLGVRIKAVHQGEGGGEAAVSLHTSERELVSDKDTEEEDLDLLELKFYSWCLAGLVIIAIYSGFAIDRTTNDAMAKQGFQARR